MCPLSYHHNSFMTTAALGRRMYGYTLWGRIASWGHQILNTLRFGKNAARA